MDNDLAAQQAQRVVAQAQQRAGSDDLLATMDEADDLDAASNGVIDLIHAGRLDEAERAARDLLAQYPDVPDGHDRLGMVYEARGQNREAADCYRQVVAFIRAHPGNFDPEMETLFVERAAKLDPTADSD